jgi:hypothetical protein
VVDAGEACDDGNANDNDTCTNSCQRPCAFDPTRESAAASSWTLSNTNKTLAIPVGAGEWGTMAGSCAGTSLDYTIKLDATATYVMFGIEKDPFTTSAPPYVLSTGYVYYTLGFRYSGAQPAVYGVPWSATGTTIRVVYASGALTFYVNGVSQGVAYSGLSGTFRPVVSVYDGFSAGFTLTSYTAQ